MRGNMPENIFRASPFLAVDCQICFPHTSPHTAIARQREIIVAEANTPNIDRLQRLILALGENASISVQRYNEKKLLWCVSRRIGEADYSHGSGDTLAHALDAEHRDRVARSAKSALPALERAAA
jgi:hypothetical protein